MTPEDAIERIALGGLDIDEALRIARSVNLPEERLDRTLFELVMRSKLPCGHWGSHAYSPDGKGKHILCLDCENARLERQLLAGMPSDDLLDRLEECLDNYSDVNDGDSGPVANTAMSLLADLKQWRGRLTREALPTGGGATNGTAWQLAEALNAAMCAPAGDPIDRGLATLRVFAERGFRIVRA